MVLQLFIGILSIVALFLLVGRKRHRLWPIVMLGLVLFLGALFFEHYHLSSSRTMVYHWLSYKSLQAQFIITSDDAINSILRMLLPMLAALLYLNAILRREEHPLVAGNIMLLSLAAFILMISARDFMQLMAGSCCFSILGFYLINDTTAKNKFIFFSFAAEMAVFTALAVVYAKTGNFGLEAIKGFAQNGGHRDLVALLLLAGILAKCGMFLFQNQLLGLQKLEFNRLIAGALLVSPLSGLVLYSKLQPLLDASTHTLPVLNIVLVLSVIWAGLGMLLHDNIKAKILYFNMLFFAFALFILSRDSAVFSGIFVLLPAVLLVNWVVMLASISASDEIYVSAMGGFSRCLKGNMVLTLGAVLVFANVVLYLGRSWAHLSYLGVSLFGLAALLHAIYFGACHADEKVSALLKNATWLYALPPLAGMAAVAYWFPAWDNKLVYAFVGGFLVLWAVLPQKLSNFLAANETLQESDWTSDAYRLVVVSPLHLLGRILWLAVDFVVIERSIIGTLSSGMGMAENLLQKIQSAGWRSYLFLTAVGTVLLLINLGVFAYE